MSKIVLVTGGSGFVAGWVIVELLKRGYRVRATMRGLTKEAAVRTAIATQIDAGDRLEFVAADLMDDAGWEDVMQGASYVLHVASPLGREAPKDPQALVAPARDGTLRVLHAAVKAGVPRIVYTSAAASARRPRGEEGVSDEGNWADPADPLHDPYRRSKIIAERAAWDFMTREGGKTELTVILPGAVFGPLLSAKNIGSVGLIQGLLNGRPPGIPRISLAVVDVRDLARLHVDAMESPDAGNQRFLALGEPLWMADIARILRNKLGTRAEKVPTRILPNWVVRTVALFIPPLRMFGPDLGVPMEMSAAKARRVLGFAPRPVADTIADCGDWLLDYEAGVIAGTR